MTPKQTYLNLIHQKLWHPQQEQAAVINYLNQQSYLLTKKNWLFKSQKIYGTYLWGGVGVGKSAIAQIFFDNTNVKKKYWTGHSFIQYMQDSLKKSTIKQVAKKINKNYKLVYIDEFEINDISSVMLFIPIINYLIMHNTYLIFTSNSKICDLYKNGLQRNHLLSTLDNMQQQLTEIELHGKDNRNEIIGNGQYIVSKQNYITEQFFNNQNNLLTNQKPTAMPLIINNYPLKVIMRDSNIIWVTLQDICGIPRSNDDYQLLATQLQILIIEQVMPFKVNHNDLITNFIHLIDIIYNHNIKLIIQSAVPINQLCPQQHLLHNKFARTMSRLVEMCQITTQS